MEGALQSWSFHSDRTKGELREETPNMFIPLPPEVFIHSSPTCYDRLFQSKSPGMETTQKHTGCAPCRGTTRKAPYCKTAISWKQGEGTAGKKKNPRPKRYVLSSMTPGMGKKSGRDTSKGKRSPFKSALRRTRARGVISSKFR